MSFSLSLLSLPPFSPLTTGQGFPPISFQSYPGELDQGPNSPLAPGELLVYVPQDKALGQAGITSSTERSLYADHCTDFHGHLTSFLSSPLREEPLYPLLVSEEIEALRGTWLKVSRPVSSGARIQSQAA